MKKSYFCNRLESNINFLPERIAFCDATGTCPAINFKGYSKNKFLQERKKIKKLLKNGIIPFECNCCFEYKEQHLIDFFKNIFPLRKKIKHIIVNHYKQCDCNCIYCTQKIIYDNDIQNYELLPVLKDFYNYNLIDRKNLRVEFQGGNVSMLKEFPQIIHFLEDKKCKEYFFLVNHIKYLDEIEKVAKTANVHVCISLDSGTKETFQKIKNVDAFETVIDNVKKLKNNSNAYISFKYIIVKGINDSIEEVKKFCELSRLLKIDAIYIDIDFRDTLLPSQYERDFKVPKHYYEILEFIKEYTKENSIAFKVMPYTEIVFKNGCA